MFTKEEVAALADKYAKEDRTSSIPTEYAVRCGVYSAMYNSAYDDYINLAKAIKRVKEALDQTDDEKALSAKSAANSFYITIALEHLSKLS